MTGSELLFVTSVVGHNESPNVPYEPFVGNHTSKTPNRKFETIPSTTSHGNDPDITRRRIPYQKDPRQLTSLSQMTPTVNLCNFKLVKVPDPLETINKSGVEGTSGKEPKHLRTNCAENVS